MTDLVTKVELRGETYDVTYTMAGPDREAGITGMYVDDYFLELDGKPATLELTNEEDDLVAEVCLAHFDQLDHSGEYGGRS